MEVSAAVAVGVEELEALVAVAAVEAVAAARDHQGVGVPVVVWAPVPFLAD